MNKKQKLERLGALVLSLSLFLSGCAEKANCLLPFKHVHKYVKEDENGNSIVRYIESEKKDDDGYQRLDEYIEISKEDEEIYELLDKKNLFIGKENWDYLYNLMASNQDYLEYYYVMDNIQIYDGKDVYGRTIKKKMKHHYEGWHTVPDIIYNTGDVRVCHHKYFGYAIERKNGKLELVKSPLVDDIREIISDFPFVCENCYEIVYEDYVFDKSDLDKITTNDLTTSFSYPNLENKNIHTGKMRVRV